MSERQLDRLDVAFVDLGPNNWAADLNVGFGIVVEFVRTDEGPWEAWAYRIGEQRYLESRDLIGEPLAASRLRDLLDRAFLDWRARQSA